MRVFEYPARETWNSLLARPTRDAADLNAIVADVLAQVKKGGDEAVRMFEERFDHVSLDCLAVTPEEMKEAEGLVEAPLREALREAHRNIGRFHAAQRFQTRHVQVTDGVECWQEAKPIQKVGLYIPGGTAPLFSTVLMLATPARIAGCEEIVLCTPPGRDGKVHPAILYAASLAGVNRIFKAGGVQAIGAMAYGTESIPKVYKIFGPGNQFVMTAKQQVSLHDVAIDMPAGPSEVCVIADDSSNATFVAADLLSQAEHGIDSQVLLIRTSEEKIVAVQQQIEMQLAKLPRREIAVQTLQNSKAVLVRDTDEAITLSNVYAPEHLIIATADYEHLADKVVNAGSVFLGEYACESAGDYASGTNHTLPTHGYATAYNGVNLDSFMRKVTFQHLTAGGISSIGRAVEVMAAAEHLDAHRNAMSVRTTKLNSIH